MTLHKKEAEVPKVVIIYETRSGNTQLMARAVEEGIKEAGVDVVSKRTANAKVEDLAGVDAVILGAPTYHHDLIGPMKTFLFQMEKADLNGKIGAAFGSYGWSGESVPDDDRYYEVYLWNERARARIENTTQTKRKWIRPVSGTGKSSCGGNKEVIS